jgi:hypothetical protein
LLARPPKFVSSMRKTVRRTGIARDPAWLRF